VAKNNKTINISYSDECIVLEDYVNKTITYNFTIKRLLLRAR
jgi:hypothetical protein